MIGTKSLFENVFYKQRLHMNVPIFVGEIVGGQKS
jgi:hypothetical protein